MRFFHYIAACTTAIVLAAGGSAANAQTARGFEVVNTNDSVSIQRVWSAQAGLTVPWRAADMNGPVYPNQRSAFAMNDGPSCFYDVKVQFSDGYEQTFANVNVCRFDRVRAT